MSLMLNVVRADCDVRMKDGRDERIGVCTLCVMVLCKFSPKGVTPYLIITK